MNNIKHWLIYSLIAFVAACSSQESADTGAAGVNAASTATKSVSIEPINIPIKSSNLLDSLAQLYPNGQLPAQRATQAAQELSQNPTALLLTSAAPSSIKQQRNGVAFQPLALAADYLPVQRVQNTTLYGAYFFSIYPTEIATALASNPDWALEGPAFWASLATGTELYPVHRFRNKTNGSYLYSIYDTERADIAANYAATFEYEGVAWYARQTAAIGWSALYRFRNKTNGTYLFSAYESEKDAIVLNYPDVFALEGIAYYVRQDAPVDAVVSIIPVIPLPAVVTSITPITADRGIATTFTITGSNLPLTAVLTVQGATCLAATGNTSTGFSQICTLSGTTGTRSLSVDSSSGGTVIDASRSVFVPALPDTGITSSQCYKADSNVLSSCAFSVFAGTAYDLNSQQDGMVGLDKTAPAAADGKLGFSYSEVPNLTGGTFPKADCVKDNLTGLVWESKKISGLHSGNAMYTNYIDDMTINGFISAVNNSSLCGFTDWRLPTADELLSIVDFGTTTGTAVDTAWFPYTANSGYWTSNPSAALNPSAFAVFFNIAYSTGTRRDSLLFVRLVRKPLIVTFDFNKFAVSANGQEVTDKQTGLIWRRCSEGQTWIGTTCAGAAGVYSHEVALALATSQAVVTNVGWRLPNAKELASIADKTNLNPSIDVTAFPTTSPTGYWTSSPLASNPTVAYKVDFSDGELFTNGRVASYSVRLVRSSP